MDIHFTHLDRVEVLLTLIELGCSPFASFPFIILIIILITCLRDRRDLVHAQRLLAKNPEGRGFVSLVSSWMVQKKYRQGRLAEIRRLWNILEIARIKSKISCVLRGE